MSRDGKIGWVTAAWRGRNGLRLRGGWAILIVVLLVGGVPAWSGTLGDTLVQAVAGNQVVLTTEIVESIKATGNEAEISGAAEQVALLLDDPDFAGRLGLIDAWLVAMKGLAPAAGVQALGQWLFQDDAQLRLVAANGLGQLGDESAIEPLVAELMWEGNSANIRQASANGLAFLGGAQATEALLAAYSAGGDELKQAVTIAIASHGDEDLQQAFASLS